MWYVVLSLDDGLRHGGEKYSHAMNVTIQFSLPKLSLTQFSTPVLATLSCCAWDEGVLSLLQLYTAQIYVTYADQLGKALEIR